MKKLSGLQKCQKEIRERKTRQSSLLNVQQFLNDDKLEEVDPDEKDDPLLLRLIENKKEVLVNDFDALSINQHLNEFDAILDKAAQEAIKKRCSISEILKQQKKPSDADESMATDDTVLDIQKMSLKPGGVVAGLKQELKKANTFYKKQHGKDMSSAEKKQFEQMWNQQYEMVTEGSLLRKDQQLSLQKVLQMSLPNEKVLQMSLPNDVAAKQSVKWTPLPISGIVESEEGEEEGALLFLSSVEQPKPLLELKERKEATQEVPMVPMGPPASREPKKKIEMEVPKEPKAPKEPKEEERLQIEEILTPVKPIIFNSSTRVLRSFSKPKQKEKQKSLGKAKKECDQVTDVWKIMNGAAVPVTINPANNKCGQHNTEDCIICKNKG